MTLKRVFLLLNSAGIRTRFLPRSIANDLGIYADLFYYFIFCPEIQLEIKVSQNPSFISTLRIKTRRRIYLVCIAKYPIYLNNFS